MPLLLKSTVTQELTFGYNDIDQMNKHISEMGFINFKIKSIKEVRVNSILLTYVK